jgi:hypothetical protein
MKSSTLSVTVLAMAVLAASPAAGAPVHEYWLGTYQLKSDPLTAMLRIEYSPAHCESSACMWILIQGPGLSGDAVVEHVDPDGSRLVLRLPNGWIADCYLVRGMPAITGTIEWLGNRRGLFALKQGVSLTSGRGSRPGPVASQQQLQAAARGSQSGPPPQSRGSVQGGIERGGAAEHAQPVSLPNPPPGTDQEAWVLYLNDNLLTAISRLFNNDPMLVNYYLQQEGQTPMTEFGRAYFRADFIQRIVPNLNR